MNIQERKERARIDLGEAPEVIKIVDNNETLQLLVPSNKILVQPIWDSPEDIEGALYKKYIQSNPSYKGIYLRQSVLRRLHAASKDIPDSWQLVVNAGHRPLAVQETLYQFFFDKFRSEDKTSSNEMIAKKTRYYVADPDRKVSPHCSGAAVDICALDQLTGKPIDFGTPVNDETEKAFTFSEKISSRQQQNRLKLLEVMLKNDFASLQSEWWHFSYGDQNWAAFYKKDTAIYDKIEIA